MHSRSLSWVDHTNQRERRMSTPDLFHDVPQPRPAGTQCAFLDRRGTQDDLLEIRLALGQPSRLSTRAETRQK